MDSSIESAPVIWASDRPLKISPRILNSPLSHGAGELDDDQHLICCGAVACPFTALNHY
jgi:hypothetical protein